MNVKNFLNEQQDPKAVEKITSKLSDLLMKGEEIGYIGVQKKPAITVFPDSIVLTNRRIIICKPKNLGLSMDFMDYTWDDIAAALVKENLLGSEFSFSTKTDMQVSIDYIPKIQARRIYTFAREQIDLLKMAPGQSPVATEASVQSDDVAEVEIRPEIEKPSEKPLAELSNEALFEKLQNYKKLLDNGLIMQSEYDRLKSEILPYL